MTTSSDAFAEALISQIKLMPPITRRATAQALAERDGRDRAFWHALGQLVASVQSVETADELQHDHDRLPELPAETADTIAEIDAADQERIAGWPPLDLDRPDDAA